ncbi:MAG TPA: PKD domain-containing protein [Chitinophagaceae bacterium]|nr:PKD domain-containing protein [Chitinophagaceae bacterium]
MKPVAIFLSLFISTIAFTQNSNKKVLFLGNSYTYVNDLPFMLSKIANSTGDTVVYDSNTPGGYTLQGHYTNSTSLSKIGLGKWDYVVLQEQSQLPSFPEIDVITSVYPYAKKLDSIINEKNNCAETIFYMTWGRKNGDASNCAFWPPVCTYNGMDSLLNLRYQKMADSFNAIVSPVGAVWNYIIKNYTDIELYSSDQSHPSLAGTFAAACSFYAVIFKKDPTKITFNSGLNDIDANRIKTAAKTVVYDSLQKWHVGEYDAKASFTFIDSTNGKIIFKNQSANANSYVWYFGDGNSSSNTNPVHTYTTNGNYTVKLLANKCSVKDSATQTIHIVVSSNPPTANDAKPPSIFPIPATNSIFIQLYNNNLIGKEYNLFSSAGKLVLKGSIKTTKEKIILNKLQPGLYILKIGEKNDNLYKIIKQ